MLPNYTNDTEYNAMYFFQVLHNSKIHLHTDPISRDSQCEAQWVTTNMTEGSLQSYTLSFLQKSGGSDWLESHVKYT